MQITIFGASGKVGRLVTLLALERGYTAVAFVHNHNPFEGTPHLIVQKGDIYSSEDIERALKGSSVIVSCLGSWGTKKRDVLSSAMSQLIPAMKSQSINRIVTLTGTGAKAPDEPISKTHKLMMKLLAPTPAGKVFFDGEEHMRLLAASKLHWTTVRAPAMTNGGNDSYRLTLKPGSALATIKRAAVAAALLDQIEASDFIQQAPIISRF